jgi:hypothetical protein
VLDVGGGIGVHAEWLSADGYAVELLDPIPRHVQRAARLAGVSAPLGDARPLAVADASQHAVLLLGPSTTCRTGPIACGTLIEARRALRPGGVIAAATINRHAAVHDAIYLGHYLQERQREAARAAATNGITLSPGRGFPAYLHDPDEVPENSPTRAFPMSNGTAWTAASGCTATSATGWKTRSVEPSCSTRSARWDRCRRCSGSAVTCSASPNAISDTWWGGGPASTVERL